MSTTIQYKGNTLATVSNDTKTLKTAGKYMEGDVVLTDTSGSGAISVVDTADSHGGTIRTITAIDISDTTAQASDVASGKYFYTADGTKTAGSATQPTLTTKNITANGTYNASSDNADGYSSVTVNVSGGGGDTWSWMGKNPTKVQTSLNEKVYLKDTAYATWTPSTTSTAIVSSRNLNSYTIDAVNYDYIVFWKFHTHFEYDGTVQNSLVTDFYYNHGYVAYGYPNSLSNISEGINNLVTTASFTPRTGLFYRNTSGVNSASMAVSTYGVYASSPNLSSTFTAITPTTLRIDARCNATYFSTASASAVNQDASYYEQVIEIWRVDLGTSPQGRMTQNIRDMWLAGDII